MCGICGIVRPGDKPVDRFQLTRMNQIIAHRGPDGDGYYLNDGVGLAMRRLAIIDVTGGDQPITNEDETLWIVYNGEAYNFPFLRARLEAQGHQFRTHTDTECVLHLYEEYGVGVLQHLRGMYAFALWDQDKQRLLLGCDRLGQKPLYYSLQDGTLYFASELNALLQALPTTPEIDLQAIDLYLSLQYIPEPRTPYIGVYKLPPASYLLWQDGRIEVERYWELDYGPKHSDPLPDLMVELRARLRQVVHMRLVSEVPLGAHLSGGIDSSIVVALMAEKSSQPVKTFSVGFEETHFSEIEYARLVAERYATEHHEFTLTFGDIPSTLRDMIAHFGEPFADPSALPLYHLARLTRQHVTVALNGDGGDEAFAGYWRYWLDPWANRYTHLPAFLSRGLIPAIADLLPDHADKPVGAGLVNGLKRLKQLTEVDQRASILRWSSYFSQAQKVDLWRPEQRVQLDLQAAENLLVNQFKSAKAGSFMERTLWADIHTYLPGCLLVKADRMSMAHSLEGRSPFLDHELASWAARLPEETKLHGRAGKYILRQAFADLLPEQILGRGKQGFGIPVGAWLRGPLHDWARHTLLDSPLLGAWFNRAALVGLLAEHQCGRVDHGKRLWALVNLALWGEGKEG